MKRIIAGVVLIAFAHATAAAAEEAPAAQSLDAERIGRIVGSQATTADDGVVRVGWARDDVAVTVDGMPLKPFAGLGSWAAFKATDHGAMMMGDTVVFQDEVTPALDAALAAGLEVTALHNHFLFDEPKVYFMHIGGMGETDKLAEGVKAVWGAIRKLRAERPQPGNRFDDRVPAAGEIDAAAIERILGREPAVKDGVAKVVIGREGAMHGVKLGATMGLSTWAAFSGSDELAAVDGDFIMTGDEVQGVIAALRRADIHVVALHNHMIGDEPTFYFLHFWGKGTVEALAKGLRTALATQAAKGDARRVEIGCGTCIYKMTGVEGCPLAIRIDGKAWLVEGSGIDDHGDAHAADGLCNTARPALAHGAVIGDRYFAIEINALPRAGDEEAKP